MTTVADILKSKADPAVHTIGPEASVFEAVQSMAQKNIGALLVVEHDQVVGMIIERDYATLPRLAGQHADYLIKQLIVFHRTDERP